MKRWYDRFRKLSKCLEKLKGMRASRRDRYAAGIFRIVQEYDPDLISETTAVKFPLVVYRRRWYDKDPYLWLIFNGLRGANKSVLRKVESYLVKELGD